MHYVSVLHINKVKYENKICPDLVTSSKYKSMSVARSMPAVCRFPEPAIAKEYQFSLRILLIEKYSEQLFLEIGRARPFREF